MQEWFLLAFEPEPSSDVLSDVQVEA